MVKKVAEAANTMNALAGGRTRASESYIPLGSQFYVGGVATEQNGQKIFANDANYPLVITSQLKGDIVKSSQKTIHGLYTVALVLLFGAVSVGLFARK